MRNLFNLSQFRSHRALRLPAGRALRINFGLWPKSRCPSVVRAFGVSRLRSTRAGLGSALIAVLAFASPAAAQDVAIVNAKLVIGDGSAPIEGGTIRSEEHTSELQSLMRISYAVFCLKNKK